MSDNRMVRGTVDVGEKELIGYSILSEGEIECDECHQNLLHVVTVKESSKAHKIVVRCAKCDNNSFTYNINGDIIFGATEGHDMLNTSTQVEPDGTYKHTVEVK